MEGAPSFNRKTLQISSSYKRFSAWILVLLFTAMWSLKSGHIWLMHHADLDKHPVCEASHDQKSAHIHDERWAKEDCTLCAFVVSVSEPFTLPTLPDIRPILPDSNLPFFQLAPVHLNQVSDSAMRRGPPRT